MWTCVLISSTPLTTRPSTTHRSWLPCWSMNAVIVFCLKRLQRDGWQLCDGALSKPLPPQSSCLDLFVCSLFLCEIRSCKRFAAVTAQQIFRLRQLWTRFQSTLTAKARFLSQLSGTRNLCIVLTIINMTRAAFQMATTSLTTVIEMFYIGNTFRHAAIFRLFVQLSSLVWSARDLHVPARIVDGCVEQQ